MQDWQPRQKKTEDKNIHSQTMDEIFIPDDG